MAFIKRSLGDRLENDNAKEAAHVTRDPSLRLENKGLVTFLLPSLSGELEGSTC